jgi:UDP-glucose 4-epimerase
MRGFIIINNVHAANVNMLSEDAADGETINIGSTDNIEVLRLAGKIRGQLAQDMGRASAERHNAGADRTHAESLNSSDLLGYIPIQTIRDDIAEFVDRCDANRNYYYFLVIKN